MTPGAIPARGLDENSVARLFLTHYFPGPHNQTGDRARHPEFLAVAPISTQGKDYSNLFRGVLTMAVLDFNIDNRNEYFRIVVWQFMAYSLPGALAGGWHGLVAAFVLSLVLAPLIVLITSKGKAGSSPSDLANELSLVRCDVVLQNYDEALGQINKILRSNPDEPEVLYLKAQIVWRGFRNHDSAVNCLNKALAVADPRDQYYGWAQNFMVELCGCGYEK
jgi:tetratricopeptide (TPR) repeat protein